MSQSTGRHRIIFRESPTSILLRNTGPCGVNGVITIQKDCGTAFEMSVRSAPTSENTERRRCASRWPYSSQRSSSTGLTEMWLWEPTPNAPPACAKSTAGKRISFITDETCPRLTTFQPTRQSRIFPNAPPTVSTVGQMTSTIVFLSTECSNNFFASAFWRRTQPCEPKASEKLRSSLTVGHATPCMIS